MHPQTSTPLTLAFVALVLICVGLLVRAVDRAAAADANAAKSNKSALLWTTGAMVILLAGTTAVGLSGILRHWDRMPPPPLIPFTAAALITIVLTARSKWGKRLAMNRPLWALVAFQAFRFPLELMLHRAHVEGALPVQMTFSGMNFDILTGVLAIPVALLAWKGKAPRGLIWAWNVMGLGLLITVVTIAVLSMPTPFRHFTEGVSTEWVTYAPFTWLPLVLVQFALGGHILVTRRLLADAKRPR